jgi:hypothetical protein
VTRKDVATALRNQQESSWQHLWYNFANLDGRNRDTPFPEDDE